MTLMFTTELSVTTLHISHFTFNIPHYTETQGYWVVLKVNYHQKRYMFIRACILCSKGNYIWTTVRNEICWCMLMRAWNIGTFWVVKLVNTESRKVMLLSYSVFMFTFLHSVSMLLSQPSTVNLSLSVNQH